MADQLKLFHAHQANQFLCKWKSPGIVLVVDLFGPNIQCSARGESADHRIAPIYFHCDFVFHRLVVEKFSLAPAFQPTTSKVNLILFRTRTTHALPKLHLLLKKPCSLKLGNYLMIPNVTQSD